MKTAYGNQTALSDIRKRNEAGKGDQLTAGLLSLIFAGLMAFCGFFSGVVVAFFTFFVTQSAVVAGVLALVPFGGFLCFGISNAIKMYRNATRNLPG